MPNGSVPKKFIECKNCGYKMEGIATDLPVGQKLTQASLPCPKCGSTMDATLKEG